MISDADIARVLALLRALGFTACVIREAEDGRIVAGSFEDRWERLPLETTAAAGMQRRTAEMRN